VVGEGRRTHIVAVTPFEDTAREVHEPHESRYRQEAQRRLVGQLTAARVVATSASIAITKALRRLSLISLVRVILPSNRACFWGARWLDKETAETKKVQSPLFPLDYAHILLRTDAKRFVVDRMTDRSIRRYRCRLSETCFLQLRRRPSARNGIRRNRRHLDTIGVSAMSGSPLFSPSSSSGVC
jgi:hypothetical protein